MSRPTEPLTVVEGIAAALTLLVGVVVAVAAAITAAVRALYGKSKR